MHQDLPTIGGVAREMLENFTQKTRPDGTVFWDFRDDVEWQYRILSSAMQAAEVPGSVNSAVFHVLMEIYVAENVEQAEDFLADIAPYATPDELTNWLNSDTRHLEYVTEILKHKIVKDGETLLAYANRLFLKRIGSRLISAIDRYLKENRVAMPSLN